ncbi:hypothetical protein EVAR_6840_1 [Eumeta japonica]|uniref:Uncharacterized protein n=1 Tax=Eumeta variegata TaxID=151549 RepID=A0A4C1U6F6_EUMVA|nr:hypothetical protein EVAR_6840_1 [Eumeta japonica]
MMSVYPLTIPLNFRLTRESFKFGPPKWGHYHWTVGVVSPTRRRPGMRQHKSSVPHLHPQEKGCGRSAYELYRRYGFRQRTDLRSGTFQSDRSNLDPTNWSLFEQRINKLPKIV